MALSFFSYRKECTYSPQHGPIVQIEGVEKKKDILNDTALWYGNY
jgi:hypothetical protein